MRHIRLLRVGAVLGTAALWVSLAPSAVAVATWATTSTPNPGPNSVVQDRPVADVAAVAANNVWAVGQYATSTTAATTHAGLVMHWNGLRWSQVATPAPVHGTGALTDVSAPAWNDVWAAGWQGAEVGSPGNVSWMIHFNGSIWRAVSTSGLSSSFVIHAVRAVTPTSVWVVGTVGATLPWRAAVAHWNGLGWRLWTFPVTGKCPQFNSITTLPGSARVIAAGTLSGCGRSVESVYVGLWNGVSWTAMATPRVDGGANTVTAVSATSVWLVGSQTPDIWNTSAPLIEHWNGLAWRLIAAPKLPTGFGTLYSVTASTATNVLAVGERQTCTTTVCGPLRTLAMHYNGVSWATVTTPNPAGGSNADRFLSTSRVPGTAAFWAVGSYGPQGVRGAEFTLAARYA